MPKTREQSEADTVRSHPSRTGYHVPTKQACLDHLGTVQTRLSDPKLTPAKRDVLEADRDALLDRLSYWLTVDSATAITDSA